MDVTLFTSIYKYIREFRNYRMLPEWFTRLPENDHIIDNLYTMVDHYTQMMGLHSEYVSIITLQSSVLNTQSYLIIGKNDIEELGAFIAKFKAISPTDMTEYLAYNRKMDIRFDTVDTMLSLSGKATKQASTTNVKMVSIL